MGTVVNCLVDRPHTVLKALDMRAPENRAPECIGLRDGLSTPAFFVQTSDDTPHHNKAGSVT
ncbi:hypothetical protein K788_0002236 [Paraburkholderia caribensis MBA4]|uniref:Uncharacterized protein n=1 Tax=Paraburkholderia caribensis MBA4 TaxID=1323664 RepID=A0A0P0R8Q3_9BURK|nr:hypothetical protein K788_0002236 [Paraburkholderia caribensis MBA4]